MSKKHNEQKLTWKQYKIYSTFEEADKKRSTLLKDNEHVKIRRCGPNGIKYKIKIGTPVKNKNTKKGKSNATE